MADYVMIGDIFESVDNMQIIRNNSQNDDGTDTVVGVDWFKFRETTANTFFVSGNTWIGMGQNAEQLRISRRDAIMSTAVLMTVPDWSGMQSFLIQEILS